MPQGERGLPEMYRDCIEAEVKKLLKRFFLGGQLGKTKLWKAGKDK